MAKVFAVFLTLILLGVWGWISWGEYGAMMGDPKSPIGFVNYVIGTNSAYNDRHGDQPGLPGARSNVQIALGAIVAFSATMLFAVTGGSGAIFSVMITAFVSFFAAAANMVFALCLLVRTGWAVFGTADPVEYQLIVYGVALYCLMTVVTAFTMMRQMPSLVRGKKSAMHAVMKCLLILLIASAGLAPLGIPEDFVVYGYHGAYWLAALCLLSLMFIGLTHSNYEYD